MTQQKNKKEVQGVLKKKNEEFVARTGKTVREAGRDKRAENIAERRHHRALERRHDVAARARDEDVGEYAAETGRVRNSDRLILYHTEPSKHTRCCFGYSCREPEPRGPM